MKTLIRSTKGKITDKWVRNNVPTGYCVKVYYLVTAGDAKVDWTWLYGFDGESEANIFLRELNKSIVYAVMYKDGRVYDEI